MSQHSKAVLVVEREDRTGVFELRNDAEHRGEGRREFLLGGRGGSINELLSLLSDEEDDGLSSRESFYLDGGLGTREHTITATLEWVDENTDDPLQMGDGGTDEVGEITEWDATYAKHPMSKWAILDHWFSETRIDSENPAVLHYGEWSDGEYVDEGVLDPRRVTVQEWNIENTPDNPSSPQVTITLTSASGVEEAAEAIEDEGR